MLIPSKFNGFHGGVRRCFGGGGGGGGGPTEVAASSTPTASAPPSNAWGNMPVNTQQGYNTLSAMKGTPWNQSGNAYNELLNQGFNSSQIKDSASQMYGAPSDSNWGMMVQNAGMNSPTGRPMAGSDQFFQPIYNTSYTNYARPATQFDTSTYGTQPVNSPALAWNLANGGAGRSDINNSVSNWLNQNQGADINTSLAAMRASGINRTDVQAAGGYNNYGPQMSMPQMQTPFNPYSNSSGYGGFSGYGQQMQNPFSYQQPSYQQQYNPYQMQSPFSYQQQPSYGGYSSYGQDFGGGVGMYTPITQQPTQPATQPNYGSSTPIVSRSAGFRGTPNVMRRAEGGIASLMDDVE